MNILMKIDMCRRGVGTTYLLGAVKSILKRNITNGTPILHENEQGVILDEVEETEEQKKPKETIGFIGLGTMGNVMGMNLLERGYNLVIYDIKPRAMEPFQTLGATAATSPKHVAEQVFKIITMLPSCADVKEVYDGNQGIFRGIQPGTLLIDTSTIDPFVAKEMSKLATSYNSAYMDAPVSGGVVAARDSALMCTCGGDVNNFSVAEELLTNMAKHIVHCGGVGCGQSAKICNNMLLAVSMIGTSEVMNLGTRLGLDKKKLAHILNISTGRCWSSELYNPCPDVISGVPSSNDYKGGFSSQLMAKDLGLAQSASNAVNSRTPMGSLAYQVYQLMGSSSYGKLDFSSVYKFLRED